MRGATLAFAFDPAAEPFQADAVFIVAGIPACPDSHRCPTARHSKAVPTILSQRKGLRWRPNELLAANFMSFISDPEANHGVRRMALPVNARDLNRTVGRLPPGDWF